LALSISWLQTLCFLVIRPVIAPRYILCPRYRQRTAGHRLPDVELV